MAVKVAAFYKFVSISDPAELQAALRALCEEQAIKGTILLAKEGINGTVSGSPAAIDVLFDLLRSDARFADLAAKFSESDDHPFQRLKVKIKREIVTFGVPDAQPAVAMGELVEPEDWNALISDPEVLLIDTRNDYEVEVGTFEGARNPKTRAFNEFPDYVRQTISGDRNKKIAMFCTGGIRCEKASAFLLNEGFSQVYQLHGGILRYLERIPAEKSLWRGECFVFDERVALEHGVKEGSHTLCAHCGFPIKRDPSVHEGLCDRCASSAASEP